MVICMCILLFSIFSSVCMSFVFIIFYCLLGALILLVSSQSTVLCSGFDTDMTIFDKVYFPACNTSVINFTGTIMT